MASSLFNFHRGAVFFDPKTGQATADGQRLLQDLRKMGKYVAVSSVSTADATDLASAIALANDNKSKLNAFISRFNSIWGQ